MPGLVKRIVLVAADEGLILYPLGQRHQRSIRIDYATHEISSLGPSSFSSASVHAESYGIVGFLSVAPVSFLVIILGREQVAQIRGVPIYVITEVAIIPLSSQVESKKAIEQARKSRQKGPGGLASRTEDSDTSDDEEVRRNATAEDEQGSAVTSESDEGSLATQVGGPERNASNVAQDVFVGKGKYGRFAERWFSQKGWSTEKRRTQGMSTEDAQKVPSFNAHPEMPQSLQFERQQGRQLENDVKVPDTSTGVAITLLPKLLRTTRMLLTSRSFFFSYDLDITRRLGEGSTSPEVPLHKAVDHNFFWNHHLTLPLTEGGHHAFVLPLMQGFIGQRVFFINKRADQYSDTVSDIKQEVVDVTKGQRQADIGESSLTDSKLLLTLISRRSVKRPGLRYLRRGVDEEGETANTVETEQILSRASWASKGRIHSFTQIRGSIPLFFSQPPYSFKPVPVLQHSSEVNQRAFKHHFANLIGRYGNVQIVLLVDKKGGEAEIGQRYMENTTTLNSEGGVAGKKLGFEWFDFHAVCRGMKFENVNLLVKSLSPKLDEFGETIEIEGKFHKRQAGILRTSCMDCLDRTNVVQSACAQRILEKQLQEDGFKVDFLTDTATLWADHGDIISKGYSSTAALKGDYTRTRRRNYRGAINDFGLTLTRYYNNIVNDYFSQAAIDYLLGNVTAHIFEEFEATLGNRDPAMSVHKVRTSAIETSSKIVIEYQKEDLVGGFCLMSPQEQDTVRTFPFEECVLLLTNAALYHVKFDWTIEKVSSFERVDLRSVVGIMKGTYIISTLAATERDPERNVGFVVKYWPGKEDVARVNSRSLSSAVGLNDDEASSIEGTTGSRSKNEDASGLKLLAFKALPTRDSLSSTEGQERQAMSEKEVVSNICEEIRRAVLGEDSVAEAFVEEHDIISLDEARKSTGLIEQWGHSLKKMVWA